MPKKPKDKHPLRRWRFESDMTLDKLSERTGIAKSYLSEIETRKKRPSFDAVIRLSKATGIPMEAFA